MTCRGRGQGMGVRAGEVGSSEEEDLPGEGLEGEMEGGIKKISEG